MRFIVVVVAAWSLLGRIAPGTGPLPLQSTDAQLVRLAVADILRTSEFPKTLYDGQRIVLDTARVGMMLGETGLVRPDERSPLPRSVAEMRELAARAGAAIAGPGDVVRCENRRCRPFDVLTVKIGDPRFAGDSAYALYRIFWLNGSSTFAVNTCSQLVVTFHRDSTGWHPTVRRSTRYNVPVHEYPIVPINRVRPAPGSGSTAAAAKTWADSSDRPIAAAPPDSLVQCNGNTY